MSNALHAVCDRLGIRKPNQFGWYMGLDTYGTRWLMLDQLGLADSHRWRLTRQCDPRNSSVKPRYLVKFEHVLVGEFATLTKALSFVADRVESRRLA